MTATNSDLASQILATDEARYQALYAQDIAALDKLLVENYLHTHANGKVDDKQAFLASIKLARYRFVNVERTGQQIRIVGSVAILNGNAKTSLDVDGEKKVLNNAFVTVWTKERDDVRLLHWQATKLPDA